MTKAAPLKPERNLASIVFSKSGKVWKQTEELPREQKQIELVIGEKFVGSLAHFRDIQLSQLQKSLDEPGDLICQDANGKQIKIQMAEAIDVTGEKLRKQRQSYLEELRRRHPGLLTALKGFRLTLTADENEPQLPNINSDKGQKAIDELASFLGGLAGSLATLKPGKRRVKKSQISGIEFFADCEHGTSVDLPVQLHWGGGRHFNPEEPRLPLVNVVLQKIEKYGKPKGPFWLVIYSSDFPLRPEDEEMVQARTILAKRSHPFDMVWFLFPYNNRAVGHLVQLWPEFN